MMATAVDLNNLMFYNLNLKPQCLRHTKSFISFKSRAQLQFQSVSSSICQVLPVSAQGTTQCPDSTEAPLNDFNQLLQQLDMVETINLMCDKSVVDGY